MFFLSTEVIQVTAPKLRTRIDTTFLSAYHFVRGEGSQKGISNEFLISWPIMQKEGKMSKESQLMEAIKLHNKELVDLLVASGADVHASGDDALLEAAAYPYPRIIQSLLAAGADVNARTSGGYTPLLIAAGRGYTESVKLLLAAGAEVDAKGTSGKTAMELASERGYAETYHAIAQHTRTK
jgi:ankyrin repeat protein